MPKIKRKANKNYRTHRTTIYPQEKPDKSKQKISIKDGLITDNAEFIDSKTSRKILEEARKQQNELEEEFGLHDPNDDNVSSNSLIKAKSSIIKSIRGNNNVDHNENDNDVDSADDDDDDNPQGNFFDQNEQSTQNIYDSFYEELRLNKNDEKALEMFMAKDNLKRKTLQEYIRDKLKEKEEELTKLLNEQNGGQSSSVDNKTGGNGSGTELDQRVIDLYRGVKLVLQRYRSGPLPKAFKIIPALSNWEQVLYLTEPDCWTSPAMFQATRLFASNLKERMAQRFFNLILLPRIRDDIEETKHLNFHLYQSLKKALFKPGAFFKGIIIPLCESGDCTLREAVIIGSILAKNHIPLLHSCAAMLKIAEMNYSGANSIFLNILLQKKYALPYRVVDAIFYHFYKFINDGLHRNNNNKDNTNKDPLPVLWHQCLLKFVQNYKNDLSSEQKESLLELIRVQQHYLITPEIRNELFQSKNRDGTDFLNNFDQNQDGADEDLPEESMME